MGAFIGGNKIAGAFINGNKQAGAFIANDKVGFGVSWLFDLIMFYRKTSNTNTFIKGYTKRLGNMYKIDPGARAYKAYRFGKDIMFAMSTGAIYKIDAQNASLTYTLFRSNTYTSLAQQNYAHCEPYGKRYFLFKTNDHKFTCYDRDNNTFTTSVAGDTTFGAIESYADFSDQDYIVFSSNNNNRLLYKYRISTNTLTTNLINTTDYFKNIIRFKNKIILSTSNSGMTTYYVRVYTDLTFSSYSQLYSSTTQLRMNIVGDHFVIQAGNSLRFYDADLTFLRAVTLNNTNPVYPVRNANLIITSDAQIINEDGTLVSNKLKTKIGTLYFEPKDVVYADGWLYFITNASYAAGQHNVRRYNIATDTLETIDTLTDEYAYLQADQITDYPYTTIASLPV